MRVYLDSSAFAKLFLEEVGSEDVERVCSRATALGLSVVCVPEVVSALSRRRRECDISAGEYAMAKGRLLEDVRDADIVQLTEPVIETALTVLESGACRTLDALHVGCAVIWAAERFVSSDDQQLKAARSMGLRVQRV